MNNWYLLIGAPNSQGFSMIVFALMLFSYRNSMFALIFASGIFQSVLFWFTRLTASTSEQLKKCLKFWDNIIFMPYSVFFLIGPITTSLPNSTFTSNPLLMSSSWFFWSADVVEFHNLCETFRAIILEGCPIKKLRIIRISWNRRKDFKNREWNFFCFDSLLRHHNFCYVLSYVNVLT